MPVSTAHQLISDFNDFLKRTLKVMKARSLTRMPIVSCVCPDVAGWFVQVRAYLTHVRVCLLVLADR